MTCDSFLRVILIFELAMSCLIYFSCVGGTLSVWIDPVSMSAGHCRILSDYQSRSSSGLSFYYYDSLCKGSVYQKLFFSTICLPPSLLFFY